MVERDKKGRFKSKSKKTETKPKVAKTIKEKVIAKPKTAVTIKVKPKVESKVAPRPKPESDYGKCSACDKSLERLLLDSRTKVPKYFIACNNKKCSRYRYVVAWQ